MMQNHRPHLFRQHLLHQYLLHRHLLHQHPLRRRPPAPHQQLYFTSTLSLNPRPVDHPQLRGYTGDLATHWTLKSPTLVYLRMDLLPQ